MWPFGKADEIKAPAAKKEQIMFCADDQPLERAAKIWRAIGMANDRFGMVPAMAAYLAMYRDWDRASDRQL